MVSRNSISGEKSGAIAHPRLFAFASSSVVRNRNGSGIFIVKAQLHLKKNMPIMKKKILIIEDEKMINYFLETSLKKDGFSVEIALNGQEALHKVYHNSYDLILTDMMIPNISGLELIMRIKKSELNSNVAILVLSGLSSADLIVEVLAVGVNDYITKPFSIKVVMAKINQLLSKNISIS